MNQSVKKKRVTIKDVAREAGVSFQTVSLVINRSELVAKPTFERVQQVIQALNYVPNVAARLMRDSRTNVLACVFFGERASYDNRLFQIQDTYWNNVVQELTRVADTFGYALVQRSQIGDGDEAYATIRDLFNGGRIDGVIAVVEKTDHPALHQLQRDGLPFVVFGTKDPMFPYVVQDNFAVTAGLVSHLAQAGCTRIGFIKGVRDGRTNEDVEERYRGFQAGMAEQGLRIDAQWEREGDWSMASGHRIIHALFKPGLTHPDGLIFSSDRMALGALKALHELGVAVPRQVRVAGYDNMGYDDYSIPPLTSVHSPVFEMAKVSISMLRDLIGENVPLAQTQKVFEAKLVVRESTGP